MPEYKQIRLEVEVYERLKHEMQPMESFSDTINRLLHRLKLLEGQILNMAKDIQKGEPR